MNKTEIHTEGSKFNSVFWYHIPGMGTGVGSIIPTLMDRERIARIKELGIDYGYRKVNLLDNGRSLTETEQSWFEELLDLAPFESYSQALATMERLKTKYQ